MSKEQGQSWDLDSEFAAGDSAALEAALAELADLVAAIEARHAELANADADQAAAGTAAAAKVAAAQAVFKLAEQAERIAADLETHAECRLSVDGKDEAAAQLVGRLQAVDKRLAAATEPLRQFQLRATDAAVDAYLADAAVAPSEFQLRHARRRRRELLPLAQENLVTSLAQDGIKAWGRLYDQLAGTIACDCDVAGDGRTRRLGLAEATGLLLGTDEARRERAWRAINAAWEEHGESCAAAINAIAGWRLEMCAQRAGPDRPVHFLDAPLHDNRIDVRTLESLLEVAEEGAPLARRAARLQAKAYGKSRYAPWDMRAPSPARGEERPLPYAEAVGLIADAYGRVEPQMGDFVRMMAAKRWIEGTVGPRKRPGAYCTEFLRSRTPRVYMTYTGSANDAIVLAHELGHAFHAWTMRDLPDSQCGYGMAVAETASTFGESVVRDALLARAETPAAKLAIVWEEATALTAFLLNIPARFTFERELYEARAERPLLPAELCERMAAAWRRWYGDCLAEPDPLFWASKLHFYIADLSFYNFPYLFGYLFSLGVHGRRQALGDEFFPRYRALLRDTGRMTAEDLAAKHLAVDLARPAFWRDTLATLAPRIDLLERLVEETAEEAGKEGPV